MTNDTEPSQASVATISNVRPPNEFDFTKPLLWPTWLKRFDRYVSVANLTEKPEKEKLHCQKTSIYIDILCLHFTFPNTHIVYLYIWKFSDSVDLLCYVMGEKAEEILNQLMPQVNADTTLQTVKDKFTTYFSPKKNTIFERFKFNSRVQQTDESVDTFITALHTLAESCEYNTLKDSLIRDRIVIGVRDTRTSERLQLTADLTLEKAVTMVRQAEVQIKESKFIRKEASDRSEVHRVVDKRDKTPSNSGSSRPYAEKKNSADKRGPCYRCGLPQHVDPKKCPARNSECRKCKKVGHWDRACRTNDLRRTGEVNNKPSGVRRVEEKDSFEETFFIGTVTSKQANSGKNFLINVNVMDFSESVEFLVDTGADVTCISQKCIPKNFENKISPTRKIILGPDGKQLNVVGVINVSFSRNSKIVKGNMYVLRGLK